jgi:putative transposase
VGGRGWTEQREGNPGRAHVADAKIELHTSTTLRGFASLQPRPPICYDLRFAEEGQMDFRDRLQRPRGYNDPGHAHELTFSCYQKYEFLSKERTCCWLADELDRVRKKLNYALYAYVFMPDHVHLIVMPQEALYDTSEFLKQLKEPVSRKAVQFLKRESPDWIARIRVQRGKRIEHHFWQPGRGHDRNILKGKTLQLMIEYTHMNPVRRKLVTSARDWKWSSAGWFEGCPLNALKPDPIPRDWLEDFLDE